MTEKSNLEGNQRLWFIRRDGSVKGPFPAGSIRRFILVGRVRMRDEVSSDRKDWQLVSKVPEVVPPEIRKSLAEGENVDLITARLREDERTGTDRRSGQPAGAYAVRRKGERRKGESEKIKRHRDTRRRLTNEELKPEKSLLPTLAVVMLVLTVIGVGFYLGAPSGVQEPDCNAPAAPGVIWRNCIFLNLSAESNDLSTAEINNAKLTNAQLSGSHFNDANLQYSDLSRADLSHATLLRARLKGANLRQANLSYADLSEADLRFADLREANLGAANIKGARFDQAIWIDGRECAPGSVGGCGISNLGE
ncbi:MAG: pentapeptide repeat-containing protein [Gammaproteobacteria bacterium]|nr:pentapeptide repeat-containing protein [Gammaproteobacteria bacterium]